LSFLLFEGLNLSDEDLHEARSKRGLITRNNALSKGEMEANICTLLDLKLVGESNEDK
jgi:hypothetical protein